MRERGIMGRGALGLDEKGLDDYIDEFSHFKSLKSYKKEINPTYSSVNRVYSSHASFPLSISVFNEPKVLEKV